MIKVAIIGRPNTGKSTLFNRFVGRRKAITNEQAGTTRDRNEYEVLWKDKKFIITDTAGWSDEESVFSKAMFEQVKKAIDEANIILFVVDAKDGLTPADFEIAKEIRMKNKNTILVVNKVDTQGAEVKGYEFYKLGFDDVIFVSASHGRAINDLLDKIWVQLKYDRKDKQVKEFIKIALVGKPNVGKSSFLNAVLKQDRAIVDAQAGTTRDCLEVKVDVEGKDYILIDTAGLHRGSKPQNDMHYLSTLSASHAIEDCDIAVLMADASQGIGETEVKIARLIIEKAKAMLVVINKWDLIEEKEEAAKYFVAQLKQKMKFASWAETIFVSAKTSLRIEKVFAQCQNIYKEYSKQVDPIALREAIKSALETRPFSSKGKGLKIKEWAQVSVKPPFFVFEVNDKELVHFSYERYLANCLREAFGFYGTPIFLKFRQYFRNSKS